MHTRTVIVMRLKDFFAFFSLDSQKDNIKMLILSNAIFIGRVSNTRQTERGRATEGEENLVLPLFDHCGKHSLDLTCH
jgi:hypothetical protein